MQNRLAQTAPTVAGHAVHRGYRRRAVFETSEDFEAYLAILKAGLKAREIKLLTYCLMANHVHLILSPWQPDVMAAMVGAVHRNYAKRRLDTARCLWNPLWTLTPLHFPALWSAAPYVELNPVSAGITPDPLRYPWSGAAAHAGHGDPFGILDMTEWLRWFGDLDWAAELRRRLAEGRDLHRAPLYQRGRRRRVIS